MLTHVGLLVGNSGGRLGRKRDELFGPDLGRLEAQAGPAGAVLEHRTEGQVAGVPAPEPRFYQHDDQVACCAIGILANAASDSSWAMTNSGTKRAISSWWKGSSST